MAEGNSEPEPQPLYIQKDVNIVSSVIEEEIIKIKLKDLPYADLQYIIAKIAIIHSGKCQHKANLNLIKAFRKSTNHSCNHLLSLEFVGELPLSVGRHPVVESTLASMKEGKGNWRHVFQNSSILYNMEKAGILKTGEARSTYVDFGTGRGNYITIHNTCNSFITICFFVLAGQLSYVLAHVVNQETDAFLIVNKSPGNPKHDKRSKIDGGIHAPIHRVLADVVDVELGRVPLVSYETGRLVGIGKHLCGDAAGTSTRPMFTIKIS